MDERKEIAPTSENEGPSCSIDKSCCGGATETSLADAGCTLNPSEMPERVARWQALFGQVLGHNVRDGEAVFRFERSSFLDAELQELVKLEEVCCAGVAWDLRSIGGENHLTLKADAGVLSVLVKGFTSGGSGGAS